MNPPSRQGILSTPEEWMKHAESDLALAQLARDNATVLPQQICFHAQQAAEKALKALLLFHKIDFPLTHDIEELLEIIEGSGIAIPADIEEAGMLTPYAVETRYPGYWGVISKADLFEAIDLSKRVMDWVKAQL